MQLLKVILMLAFGHLATVHLASVPPRNVLLIKEKVPLELEYCKNLGYTETSKINFMKQTQNEAKRDSLYKSLLFLDKTGCSDLVQGFTCATYAPAIIAQYGTALPPCKSLCKSTEKACWRFIEALAKLRPKGKALSVTLHYKTSHYIT